MAEMSFGVYFNLSSGRHCAVEQNDLSNFSRGPPNEESYLSLVVIRPVVTEKMSFDLFSIFRSGGHLVQRSRTI